MVLIYLQFVILCGITLGWTYWLHRWTTDGSLRWPRGIVLFCAAFAAQILILQNLVYLDIPVQTSFPVPAAIGVAGLLRMAARWRANRPIPLQFRYNARAGAAVFLAVFSLQSVSAISEGPSNYYGKAHIDHLNYAFIGEFVRTLPFSTPSSEAQAQPWLVRPLHYKNLRIGQSVAQAYVASLSFVSAKEAYAALCSFVVALLALAVLGLVQSFSLPRVCCILAALWAALAPSTTRIHLDGFLSQACVLFVFPALILWARLAQESLRFRLVTGTLLAAHLLVCYTEFFVIGVFLLGSLTLAQMAVYSYRRILVPVSVVLLGLVLVPAYLPRAIQFVLGQYAIASNRSPALEVLAPDGGTLYGWTKALLELPVGPAAVERQAIFAAGILLMALAGLGLYSRSRRNFLFLAAATLTPAVFLGILLSAPVLAKYPFMKISDSFTFLWILLVMRGISAAALRVRRQWPQLAPPVFHAVPAALLLLALPGFTSQHKLIAARHISLAVLLQPAFTETLRFVSSHPERTYVIRYPDGLAAGWIAYEARHSRVFIVSRALSDVPLSPGEYAFSRLPDNLSPERVTSITPEGFRDIPVSGDAVDLEVYNPQGQDGGGDLLWYWLGDEMTVEAYRWSGDAPKDYSLRFEAEPGPANPAPGRTIRLTSLRTGAQETREFTGRTQLQIPVSLVRGRNSFRMESVDPLEHVHHVPNDPRKHMTRISGFSIANPAPATAQTR